MSTNNEIIIGLGGVGGRSIAAFRRAQHLRINDTNRIEKAGARFEYMYIDSNDDILGSDIWNIFGTSVKLEPRDIVMLKQAGQLPTIREISSIPNISEWIGDITEQFGKRKGSNTDDVERELQGLKGAGQLRRYGRVLFAMHVDKVRNTLKEKIARLRNGRESDVNFRLFCTLGGGTGSGSIVDMVTLIKTIGQEENFAANVYVYPFVAGNAAEAANSGSFYENEYAALRDLNALMVHKYKPYVVGRTAGRNQGNEFDIPEPINTVTISSELAPGSPSLPEQVDYMAKACFDAIIYSFSHKEPNCLKAVSGEDLVDVTPGEPAGQPIRSYRFSAFGARRWCVPTAQIKDLLKYDCEKRILEGWLKGAPLPKGMTKRDFTPLLQTTFELKSGSVFKALNEKKDELLQPLKDEIASIEKENKRESTLLLDMAAIADSAVEKARSLMSDGNVLAKLDPCYDMDAEAIFKNIQDGIDRVLTWKAAVGDAWGLKDVSVFLDQYIQQTTQWPATLLAGESGDEETDRRIRANMQARAEEWDKLGPLTIWLTSLDEKMIRGHSKDAEARVMNTFLGFRRVIIENLCERVAQRLNTLKRIVDNAIRDLNAKIDAVNNQISKFESDLVKNAENNGFGDMFEYDKENLYAVREHMGKETKALQSVMASTYSPEWAHFIQSIADYTSDKLDSLCHELDSNLAYRTSEELHEKACTAGNLKPVLIGSIFDRLAQIAGPEESLWESRLGDRVRKFLNNLGMSTNLQGSGLQQPQKSPAAAIVFGLPSKAGNVRLMEWLKNKLQTSLPSTYSIKQGRSDIFEHECEHEIRVLYMPYWLPARFASVVDLIYNKYVDTAQQSDGDVKMYFANIDDNDNGLTSANRPPLTDKGDPDQQNMNEVDLGEKLFVTGGERRRYIVKSNGSQISLLLSVDSYGKPKYSDDYPNSMREFPSSQFKRDLRKAYELAKASMTDEEKRAIVQELTNVLDEMEERGVDEISDEYKAADEVRTLAIKKLEV